MTAVEWEAVFLQDDRVPLALLVVNAGRDEVFGEWEAEGSCGAREEWLLIFGCRLSVDGGSTRGRSGASCGCGGDIMIAVVD